jgi:hypothetical protein
MVGDGRRSCDADEGGTDRRGDPVRLSKTQWHNMGASRLGFLPNVPADGNSPSAVLSTRADRPQHFQ